MLKEEHGNNEMAKKDLASEVNLLGRLEHAHLPRLHAVGQVGCARHVTRPFPRDLRTDLPPCCSQIEGNLFIVIERLYRTLASALPPPKIGTPLWTYAAAVRQWPLKRALSLAYDLAGVLSYLHGGAIPGVGVMHRDVKPDNIGFAASDGRRVLTLIAAAPHPQL